MSATRCLASRLIHFTIDLHAHVAALGRYNTSWQLPQISGLIGGARTGLLPPRHATRASWLVRSQDFPRRPQLDLVREWMRRSAVVAVLADVATCVGPDASRAECVRRPKKQNTGQQIVM